jgi:TonB family protein
MPESTPPVARHAAPAILPLEIPQSANQPLVALSPMPARPDKPVALPAGESRGEFAISPQPNLTFPGMEAGGRPNASNTPVNNAPAGLVNLPASGSTSAKPANSPATASTGNNAFPGITILGESSTSARNSTSSSSTNSSANSPASGKSAPPPLQTSYGITILASGGSGGGLPDFGVFVNDQVHTVYLDMRRTIQDEPITWTVEFGVKQPEATSADERVATVRGQQEVILPFPIDKQRPVMSQDLVRKYSGRLVVAYAVVTPEGKMEQLSIKQSPDPAVNDSVLSALRNWTFRPARRNGEVISAKILLGIPVRGIPEGN